MCSDRASHDDDHGLFPPLPREVEEALEGMEAGELPDDLYTAILESQCGATDDSQPVEQYDGTLGVTRAFVDAQERPVGQLQWNDDLAAIYTNPGNVSGVRWCTGALIGDNLFLTAGHCFDRTANGWGLPRVNGTNTVISSQEIATRMHVNFNFQVDPVGNPRPEQSFAVTQLIEYRLGNLDFAILRLEGDPHLAFGTGAVAVADAAEDDPIAIIGHPAGQPKRIEAGPVTDLTGDRITYNDIDTLGGNSGSAIWLSPAATIVGVHTNGGCTTTGGGANFGMRIGSILPASPTLQALTNGQLDAKVVLGETAIAGPGLAALGDRMVLSWTGTDEQHHVNVISTDDSVSFHSKVTLGELAIGGPALAAGDGRLFLAWSGVDELHHLNVLASDDGVTFFNKVTLEDFSPFAPALAYGGGRVWIAWTGADANRSLNVMSSADGVSFQNKVTLGDNSFSGPGLTWVNGRLYLAWAGTDEGRTLNVMSSADGTTFDDKRTFWGDNSHAAPALAPTDPPRYSWTGTDQDHHLNSFRNLNQAAKIVYSDLAFDAPATAVARGGTWIAWTGTDQEHHLNLARIP
jgi:V8-like Glu-specific endopeptidase